MAEELSVRLEDCLIAQRRDYESGELRIVVNITGVREAYDPGTAKWRAIEHTLPTEGVVGDAQELLADFSVALASERDALEAQLTQQAADHTAEVEALNTAHTAAMATATEAHQAEVAALNEAHATALGEVTAAKNEALGARGAALGEIATLEAQLAQANTDKVALQADKAALQAQIDELTAEPERQAVLRYRFDAALELLPSLTGAEGRTLGEDFDAFKDGLPRAIQKRLNAPEYYRDDEQLNQLATVMVATFQPDNADPGATAQALLDQAFALAPTIP